MSHAACGCDYHATTLLNARVHDYVTTFIRAKTLDYIDRQVFLIRQAFQDGRLSSTCREHNQAWKQLLDDRAKFIDGTLLIPVLSRSGQWTKVPVASYHQEN